MKVLFIKRASWSPENLPGLFRPGFLCEPCIDRFKLLKIVIFVKKLTGKMKKRKILRFCPWCTHNYYYIVYVFLTIRFVILIIVNNMILFNHPLKFIWNTSIIIGRRKIGAPTRAAPVCTCRMGERQMEWKISIFKMRNISMRAYCKNNWIYCRLPNVTNPTPIT